jgi:hypothetical protein
MVPQERNQSGLDDTARFAELHRSYLTPLQ